MIAVAFWVLKTTGSKSMMGITMAAFLVPSLIVGLISGVFVDWYSLKSIIITTDIIRGITIILVALSIIQGTLTFRILLLSQVILSVNTAFFDPAIPTIISFITHKKDLIKINAKTQLISGIATIIGPVMGGITIGTFGLTSAFLFNAIFAGGLTCVIIAVIYHNGLRHIFPYLLIYIVTGASIILGATCFRTAIQKEVDKSFSGRVFGVVTAIGNGSIPLAMMIYGFMFEFINFPLLIFLTGLLLMVNSVIFMFYMYGGKNVKRYKN